MAWRLAALAALCAIAFGACAKGSDTTDLAVTQHRTMVVNDDPTPICLALPATVGQRVEALANRATLPPKEGMAFPFATPQPATFSMKDTSFPLAVVWVGPGSQVLGSTVTTPHAGAPYASPAAVTLAVQLSPQDWGPLAGTARTLFLGESCDGTITAGRPGQPPTQF